MSQGCAEGRGAGRQTRGGPEGLLRGPGQQGDISSGTGHGEGLPRCGPIRLQNISSVRAGAGALC